MARRPRTPPSAAQTGGDGERGQAGNGPFAALRRQLREQQEAATRPALPPASPPPGTGRAAAKKTPPAPSGGARADAVQAPDGSGTAPVDEAERALFRQALGAVRPLRRDGRAEIEPPRPAPVPRRRERADEDLVPPPRHAESDPLQAAYAGVVPLRDRGRVELETAHRHHARAPATASSARIQRPDAIVLPAEVEASDPAALFRLVVGDTRPLDHDNRVELERPAPAPAPVKHDADERAALDESLIAPLTFEDRLDMGDEAAFLRAGLPRRVLTDLRRGRWVLQGQIDLHGLTRDEARAALGHFLHDSLSQGRRCIRVIHGKGHGSPGKESILKQLSRGWLAQREEILAFCQAGPHEGGSGALLVLLRARNATPRRVEPT